MLFFILLGNRFIMKRFNYLPLVIFLCFAACGEQTNPMNQSTTFVKTTKPFKKEIPTYTDGGNDIFYNLAKKKQKQLGLDSLESGFSDLQIRVWYDFSLVRERKLVIIKNENASWAAMIYDLQVNWDGLTETILSKKIRQATPKSGWADFSKKLLDLQVLTLPNQDDIPNYGGGNDGTTYSFEVATQNQYRFYGYWEPQEYQDKFWQAKNIVDILRLFETELGIY